MTESARNTNLLFITGTRADYGKVEPLARAAHEAGFRIAFFITGMHMMKHYGETRLEVRKFKGASFFEYVNQRHGDTLECILSKTVTGLSDFLYEHRPDLVVVHGDRIEALAASLVCATMQIRSSHIEGGETSGTIDESIRHCNTKLCTTHFVSSETAKARVVSLGESPDRIFAIGSPELDTHALPSGVSLEEVKSYYQIPFNEYGIAIFHPVVSETDTIEAQAKSLFKALSETKKCFVVISPNNDPGTEKIFAVQQQLPRDRFRLIPSMRFRYFSELMKNSAVLVGNSSAGVREAPFVGVPSLDIGSRQTRRALSNYVGTSTAFEHEKIVNWVQTSWMKRNSRCDAFGNGSTAMSFVNTISNPSFWTHSLQKSFFEGGY